MRDKGIILGIETSCDETAVAVLKNGSELMANVVFSQIEIHRPYGGVVPEIASRNHLQNLPLVLQEAMDLSQLSYSDLDAIAATRGPGLIPSLLVGLSAGKGLAFSLGIPFLGINHLRAHVYALYLNDPDLHPPMIVTLVSGGHTQILYIPKEDEMVCIGNTRDDAAGEAFDKGARILGLAYPGGPSIEQAAKGGDKRHVLFPTAFMEPGNYDFSYSGLKTSLLYFMQKHPNARVEDVAASFQEAIVEPLIRKSFSAARRWKANSLLFAGGVAANNRLRERALAEASKNGIRVLFPPVGLCTDNAAMVAMAGWKRYIKGNVDSLKCPAVSSLSIEQE